MSKITKRPALTETKRAMIGRDRINDKLTIRELVEKHNCSTYQARLACEQYDAGIIGKSKADEKRRAKKIKEERGDKSAKDMLVEIIDELIVDLQASDMEVRERFDLAKKATDMLVKVQNLDLVQHVKDPDANKIIEMCKILKPEIKNSEIIEIYEKACGIVQGQKRRVEAV